jgi:hypothetical protein
LSKIVTKTGSFKYNYLLKSIELLYGHDRQEEKEYPLKKYLEDENDKYHGCEQVTPGTSTCPSSSINGTSFSCSFVGGKCYDSCDVCLFVFANVLVLLFLFVFIICF